MENSSIIDKHDMQIDTIRDTLSEITTNLTVMLKDHSHLSEKVDEILVTVKLFKDSENKITRLEDKIEDLNVTITKLQTDTNSTQRIVKNLESQFSFSKFFIWLKKYWYLWGVVAPSLGIIADILYKIDPRG